MKVKRMISYRDVWMGIAILMVVFYHAGISVPSVVRKIKDISYGGVDIFLFASGIGNYFSYLRDEDPLGFMKRRIKRLAPAYIPIILVWCAFYVINRGLSIWFVPGNILGVQGFSGSGENINWYIMCILFFYLLTPFLASLVRKNSLLTNVLLVVILIIVSFSFFEDRLIIAMTRLPIYAMGMIFAKYSDFDMRKILYVITASFAVGLISLLLLFKYATEYLSSYGLHWYPFILMVPFMSWIISEIAALLEKVKLAVIVKFFGAIGAISFELFLIHVFAFDVFENRINASAHKNILWIGCIVLTIIGAYIYSKVIKAIFSRKKAKE